jgi:urease accessory protein
METFQGVVGHHSDEAMHDLLHELDHAGKVVHLRVPTAELGRRRFKAVDQHGVEYGVALARSDELRDGSVLSISTDRAVVVDADEGQTLTLRATTLEGAVQLGWHAGHLHWRVRMDADTLMVLLDAPREEYLVRIAQWTTSGSIEVEG